MSVLEDDGTSEGRGMFGTNSIGSVFYGQFECSNCSHSGFLLMGNKALCFFGKFFALERRLVMSYESIFTVDRFKKNGIRITMTARGDGPKVASGKGEEHVFYFNTLSFQSASSSAGLQTNRCVSNVVEDLDDVLNLLLDLCERYRAGFLINDTETDCADMSPMVAPLLAPRSLAGLRASVKFMPHPLNRKVLNVDYQTKEEMSVSPDNHSRLSPDPEEDSTLLQSLSPSQALAAIAAMADFRSFSMALKDQRQMNTSVKNALALKSREDTTKIANEVNENVEELETGSEAEWEPENLRTAWDELKLATPAAYKESALIVRDFVQIPFCRCDIAFSFLLLSGYFQFFHSFRISRFHATLTLSSLQCSPPTNISWGTVID